MGVVSVIALVAGILFGFWCFGRQAISWLFILVHTAVFSSEDTFYKLYDLTDYVIRHPGGNEILRACGTDATSLFNSRQSADGRERVGSGAPHSQAAAEQLARLKIGTLTKK